MRVRVRVRARVIMMVRVITMAILISVTEFIQYVHPIHNEYIRLR